MLASRGLHSVTAVEPNENMLEQVLSSTGDEILWCRGTAEATGLPAAFNPMTWLRWPHPFIGLISKSPAENFSVSCGHRAASPQFGIRV